MVAPQTNITQEDLRYVLNNPWSVSKAEWRLGDENSRKTMFSYITDLLDLTTSDGYSKIWRDKENKPIAILGGYRVSDKKYTTFFICSEHYEDHAMKLSFEMRKTLREKARQYKGCTLGIYSISKHPGLFSWLRFFGFKPLPDGDNGDWQYFEFIAPSS